MYLTPLPILLHYRTIFIRSSHMHKKHISETLLPNLDLYSILQLAPVLDSLH